MDMEKRIPLIDLHTHILPGIDDGARNEGEGETMLRSLLAQQTECVVLTPHFSPDKMPLDAFVKQRQRAFDRLCRCPDTDVSVLVLASETLLSQSLFSYEDISPLCINGKYLLLELPFETVFSKHICNQIMKVSYQYGVTPILAHIERYPHLMRHPKILDELIENGMLTQINVSSLATFRKRRHIWRLIRSGRVHLLGTDCHHPVTRPPEFRKWTDLLESHLGKDTLEQLIQNAQDILSAK